MTILVSTCHNSNIRQTNREKDMRFTVEKNWCDRDNMYFYDVVDHHPLRHRRVVSWYTEKPTFKGDRNYGYDCAKEDADHFNLKFGYDTGHLAEQTFNKREVS